MIKIRLKKYGRKGKAFYRIVLINSSTKRDGRVLEELGFYSPLTKEIQINVIKTRQHLKHGVQPTKTVLDMITRCLKLS